MEITQHIAREFTFVHSISAVIAACVFIIIMSLVKEPQKQKINALLIAGAGAVYWSGGLGIWEFTFGAVMLFVAYKGLKSYYFIGIGWILHTIWDIVHHYYGQPIVYLSPSSSAGCAVFDTILAIWFLLGAPSVFILFSSPKKLTV